MEKHHDIFLSIFAGPVLSGCTLQQHACYGVGKGKMLKVLRKNAVSLDVIGNIQADCSDMMAVATKFTAECYGQSMATSMSEARVSLWTAQIE